MAEDIRNDFRKDWFLETLGEFANSAGLRLGLTLTVKGLIVSGILASAEEYFKEMAETVSSDPDKPELAETGDVLKDFFLSIAEQTGEAFRRVDKEQGDEENQEGDVIVEYIHLRESQILHSNGFIPTNQKVWWRGKISSVDGFILGSVTPGDD